LHQILDFRFTPTSFEEKRTPMTNFLLALLSGLLLTASFPPGKLAWIAWFALVPLLKAVEKESPSGAFRLGLLCGLTHYTTLIYWVVFVLGHYGNLNIFASLGPCLLLCLYLAMFPACFAFIIRRSEPSRFPVIGQASLWVALEFVRGKALTGFPWCLLGYTQYERLTLIQVAEIGGVYGISFLVLLWNVALFCWVFADRSSRARFLTGESVLCAFLTAAALAYGVYDLSQNTEKDSGEELRAVLVQGNIDQSLKWDQAYQAKTMDTYQGLTRASFPFRPELIIWPETAMPFFFQDNREFSPLVFSLIEESGASLLFGSPAYERKLGGMHYYNRAYLISPGKQQPQYYDKIHLTPFGEYVPLKKYLFFVNRLVHAAGDFEPGQRLAPLAFRDLAVGVLICFEGIFPELARAQAKKGARILVNITNDAWFGMTSAPHQHLMMTIFRAVETGLPLLRAANTGITAVVGPDGRIQSMSKERPALKRRRVSMKSK
jgi:apolipoprotein N-acyltransferase